MSIVNLNITRIHRDMVPLHGVEEAKTTLLTSRSFLEYKVAKPVDVIFFHLGINIQRSRNAPDIPTTGRTTSGPRYLSFGIVAERMNAGAR